MMRSVSIQSALERFSGIGPGFHFLRHALAAAIIFHHVRLALSGHGATQKAISAAVVNGDGGRLSLVDALRPGSFALVGSFFALSGFLVFGSAIRSKKLSTFFAARAFRLFPALAVEVVLSALLLGPIVTSVSLGEYFTSYEFYRYFGNIVGEIYFYLPGVFLNNPLPRVVNQNLWTLPPELWCYAAMLFFMASGLTRRPRILGASVVAIMIMLQVSDFFDLTIIQARANSTHFTAEFLVIMFVLGAAMFANADVIPLHPVLFAIATISYWALMMANKLQPFAGFLLCYMTVYVGMVGFGWFDRLLKMDLSYGAYLYGFPIMQALVFFLLPKMHGLPHYAKLGGLFVLTIALTSIFASLSWTYIEKPALGLRKKFFSKDKPGTKKALNIAA